MVIFKFLTNKLNSKSTCTPNKRERILYTSMTLLEWKKKKESKKKRARKDTREGGGTKKEDKFLCLGDLEMTPVLEENCNPYCSTKSSVMSGNSSRFWVPSLSVVLFIYIWLFYLGVYPCKGHWGRYPQGVRS